MKNETQTKLIAIVGGSGSGKSWLANHLEEALQPSASVLSLDNFYFDLSSLSPEAREKINFDHPQTIDWPLFESVLDDCLAGRATGIPQYDFATHTRLPEIKLFHASPIVLVEGLWLLHEPKLLNWFDLKIFLDSPGELRLKRRLIRDVTARGRTPDFVRDQFHSTVAPMHKQFVASQIKFADVIVRHELGERELLWLTEMIQSIALETNEPLRRAQTI